MGDLWVKCIILWGTPLNGSIRAGFNHRRCKQMIPSLQYYYLNAINHECVGPGLAQGNEVRIRNRPMLQVDVTLVI